MPTFSQDSGRKTDVDSRKKHTRREPRTTKTNEDNVATEDPVYIPPGPHSYSTRQLTGCRTVALVIVLDLSNVTSKRHLRVYFAITMFRIVTTKRYGRGKTVLRLANMKD